MSADKRMISVLAFFLVGAALACEHIYGQRELPPISVSMSDIRTPEGLRTAIAEELDRVFGRTDVDTSWELAYVNIRWTNRPATTRIPVIKLCERTWADALREVDLGVFNGLVAGVGGGSGHGGGGPGGGPTGGLRPIWGVAEVCVDQSTCYKEWMIIGWEWIPGTQTA